METQQQQLPIQMLVPLEEKIHPELNLEKWSIWKPSKSPLKSLETQVLKREHWLPDGSKITSKVEVGFTNRGVLTTEDRKTYYALIKIWEDKGRPLDGVSLSLRRLAKVLNKKWGTNVIDSLTQSLLRLRFTPFTWENSYFNAETEQKEELLTAFTVLSEVRITRKQKDGHSTKERGFFQFNEHILGNLLRNHTKPLYLDTLLTFKTEIAQLLYTYLDLIMADKTHYQRRSAGLFEDLGLTANTYRKPSNRRQKLEKALAELQNVPLSSGILAAAHISPAKNGRDFKVVFRKQPYPKNGRSDANQTAPFATEVSLSAAQVVAHFHQQLGRPGYTPTRKELNQADDLLARYSPEQVRFLIDYALQEAQKTHFTMRWFGATLQYEEAALAAWQERQQQQAQAQKAQARQQELLFGIPEQLDIEAFYQQLDEKTKARILVRAEQKLAAYKANMQPDAYAETLQRAILQEAGQVWQKRHSG
jgi:hypothetical protein